MNFEAELEQRYVRTMAATKLADDVSVAAWNWLAPLRPALSLGTLSCWGEHVLEV